MFESKILEVHFEKLQVVNTTLAPLNSKLFNKQMLHPKPVNYDQHVFTASKIERVKQ